MNTFQYDLHGVERDCADDDHEYFWRKMALEWMRNRYKSKCMDNQTQQMISDLSASCAASEDTWMDDAAHDASVSATDRHNANVLRNMR